MAEPLPPLTALTLGVVLEYIAPPSNLPLPTYLISRDLLKRHHFLGIAPDNAAQYLCWASDQVDSSTVIGLLESLPTNQHLSPSIRYSSDPECILAHAHLAGESTSGLRLVFQWDPADNAWKFHNAALMPFPPSTTMDIPASHPDFIPEPSFEDSRGVDDGEQEGDSYWDAYGRDDDNDEAAPSQTEAEVPGNSEDAYWAQYSTVQGSGDSTIPSPVSKRKALEKLRAEDPIHFSHSTFTTHDPKLSPPSPRELDALLKSISPRLEHKSLAPDDERSLPDDQTVTDTPSPTEAAIVCPAKPDESLLLRTESNDHALKSGIKSLYTLWLGGKHDSSASRENFLQLAKEAF
jgi:hypothetical protein